MTTPFSAAGTVFLYKVVKGLVPAIDPEEFLVKSKSKRITKPRRFDGFESAKTVINSVNNSVTWKRFHARLKV